MKKILISSIILLSLFSCEKEFNDEKEYTPTISNYGTTYSNYQRPIVKICWTCRLKQSDDSLKFAKNHYIGTDEKEHCFIYYGIGIKNDSIEINYGDTIQPYIPKDKFWRHI